MYIFVRVPANLYNKKTYGFLKKPMIMPESSFNRGVDNN